MMIIGWRKFPKWKKREQLSILIIKFLKTIAEKTHQDPST
jgi:hypothetical protein